MKNSLIRMIAMLLLLGLAVCLFACNNEQNTPTDTDTKAEEDTVEEGGLSLPFKKENYQKEFKILYYTGTLYRDYFFDDVTEAGDVVKQAIVDRRLMVEDYLGVYIVGVAESSREDSVLTAVQRDALAGIDQYQVALTHGYLGVTGLVSEGLVRDLYEFEDISFNDEYWNVEAIESLEVGGKAYFGSSDFMISDVCAVLFNKEMYSDEAKRDQ